MTLFPHRKKEVVNGVKINTLCTCTVSSFDIGVRRSKRGGEYTKRAPLFRSPPYERRGVYFPTPSRTMLFLFTSQGPFLVDTRLILHPTSPPSPSSPTHQPLVYQVEMPPPPLLAYLGLLSWVPGALSSPEPLSASGASCSPLPRRLL